MREGRFIVIEGGEGAGKDSVIKYLREKLGNRGDVIFTREPGGTAVAERIRSILMEMTMPMVAELMLFCAARADHVRRLITPNLEQGNHIICNRFSPSTIAYQIQGRDRRDLFQDYFRMNIIATDALKPDIVVYLDVEPEIGLQRKYVSKEGFCSKFDRENIEFHRRVRESFIAQWKQSSFDEDTMWFFVPTTEMPEKQVQIKVWEILEGFLEVE